MARRGEQVGAERELAALELRQPPQHADEGLLGGVGRVVLGAEDAQAEVVRALLVAAVELGERIAVARDGALQPARLRLRSGPPARGHPPHRYYGFARKPGEDRHPTNRLGRPIAIDSSNRRRPSANYALSARGAFRAPAGRRRRRALSGSARSPRSLAASTREERRAHRSAAQPGERLRGHPGTGVRADDRRGACTRRGGRARARRARGPRAGRADAVAGEAEGVSAPGRPEKLPICGMWLGETSIGPPQACVRRRPRTPGNIRSRSRATWAATSRSTSTRPFTRAPQASRPPPQPSTMRPSRRGAEVVQEQAAVRDALAAGPADLLEQVRHRLGHARCGRR